MARNSRGFRHDHRLLKGPEYAFNERRAIEADHEDARCMECWATQFRCPCCGPCTNGMVTTKKTCLFCDEGLIRLIVEEPRCRYHEAPP